MLLTRMLCHPAVDGQVGHAICQGASISSVVGAEMNPLCQQKEAVQPHLRKCEMSVEAWAWQIQGAS